MEGRKSTAIYEEDVVEYMEEYEREQQIYAQMALGHRYYYGIGEL